MELKIKKVFLMLKSYCLGLLLIGGLLVSGCSNTKTVSVDGALLCPSKETYLYVLDEYKKIVNNTYIAASDKPLALSATIQGAGCTTGTKGLEVEVLEAISVVSLVKLPSGQTAWIDKTQLE